MATSTDLRAAIEEVQNQLPDEQLAGDVDGLYEADFATRIEERVGALPWWVISAVVHSVIFLLCTLIGVALPPPNMDEVTITTDMAKQEEPKYDQKKKRDIFKNPQEVKAETQVENPVVVHEQTEVTDHFETDNNMDNQNARGSEDAISDIPLGGTGVTGSMGVGGGGMAGCFGYRDGGGRKKAVARFGGSPATESAVEAALRWLARHQEADGQWDAEKWEGGKSVSGGRIVSNVSVSALAVLAFLGAGHTHKAGKFKDNVNRGLKWLASKQLPSGAFVREGSGYQVYDHCTGALTLAEAYGMTKDPALRTPAQKGVDYVLKIQEPYGGWRHGGYRSTSVMGWAVMALKSAKIAGLKVDGNGFQGATNRLDQVTDPASGKVGYTRRGQYNYGRGLVMTGVGMVCRQFMGVPNTSPVLRKQAALLVVDPPKWEAKSRTGSSVQNLYHWYYGTLAMFQMGGEGWKKWNKALKPTLVNNQHKGGPMDGSIRDIDGSWDPYAGWAPTGGRVYSTALGALSLEVYYRYLPMYSK
jgi:Squalene-hopene cyclase C-terminal domain/Prenyltransferase and squalene oxidase repeat